MKISILGTNGFLSTAIAKYANEAEWNLDMYGLDEPTAHKFDNFYKVNLMDTALDCSGLLASDIIIYVIERELLAGNTNLAVQKSIFSTFKYKSKNFLSFIGKLER